jgi:uncharacterized coiled-coil protein SlyX
MTSQTIPGFEEQMATLSEDFLSSPPGYNPDGSLKTPPPEYPGLNGYRLLEKMGE